MGADGGVTLVDYEKLTKWLEKPKRRLKFAAGIDEDEWPAKEVIDAILDNDLKSLTRYYPFVSMGTVKARGTEVKVLTVSFGTNVMDPINDLESAICAQCHDSVVWTGETWT